MLTVDEMRSYLDTAHMNIFTPRLYMRIVWDSLPLNLLTDTASIKHYLKNTLC